MRGVHGFKIASWSFGLYMRPEIIRYSYYWLDSVSPTADTYMRPFRIQCSHLRTAVCRLTQVLIFRHPMPCFETRVSYVPMLKRSLASRFRTRWSNVTANHVQRRGGPWAGEGPWLSSTSRRFASAMLNSGDMCVEIEMSQVFWCLELWRVRAHLTWIRRDDHL